MTGRNKAPKQPAYGVGTFQVAVALATAAVLLWVLFWKPSPSGDAISSVPPPAANSVSTSSPPAATSVPSDPLKAVTGKWLRPDGGYILEIQSVRTDGKAEVGYFNPSPINVSRSEIKRDGAGAGILVELRDANYPGCIYRLTYDPKSDELRGQYFQAALEETFDVVFVRSK